MLLVQQMHHHMMIQQDTQYILQPDHHCNILWHTRHIASRFLHYTNQKGIQQALAPHFDTSAQQDTSYMPQRPQDCTARLHMQAAQMPSRSSVQPDSSRICLIQLLHTLPNYRHQVPRQHRHTHFPQDIYCIVLIPLLHKSLQNTSLVQQMHLRMNGLQDTGYSCRQLQHHCSIPSDMLGIQQHLHG